MAALLSDVAPSFDRMHDVGQHAMDEIYISWEESVLAAADRYQTVLEMQRAGLLKPRRHGKSDKFLTFTTDVMDGLYDTFHFPKALFYGTKGTVHSGLSDIKEGLQDFRTGIHTGFRDVRTEMKDSFKNMRSDVRESYQEIKDEMHEGYHDMKDEVKEGFAEIRDIMLDNLEGMRENFAEAGEYLRSKSKSFHEEMKDLKKEFDDEWNRQNGTKN
jgi:hypothetical protein